MYMTAEQLAAFDAAYAPRAVTRALPRAPPAPAPAALGSPLAAAEGGLSRLQLGAFGRAALGVRKATAVGVHPIAHQVDKIHGYLSKQSLVELCRTTGFTRAQLLGFWLQYKSLCSLSSSPLGVDVGAFRRFVPTVTLEDSLFVERVFAVLDRSGSTLISWPDFLGACAVERGSAGCAAACVASVCVCAALSLPSSQTHALHPPLYTPALPHRGHVLPGRGGQGQARCLCLFSI